MTFTNEKFDRSVTHHTIQVNGVRLHYVTQVVTYRNAYD
jgi:hypothetical protein